MTTRHLAPAIAVIGLLLLAAACSGTPTRRAAPVADRVGLTIFTPSERAEVPPLSGTTLGGRRLTTSYAGGSPLVINVWASWCSPCGQELPVLARAARHGVRVVGLDERDDTDHAVSFADEHGVTYPSLQDPDGRLLASLRLLPLTGIPSTLIVTSEGRVRARVIGPLDGDTLRQGLRRAAP